MRRFIWALTLAGATLAAAEEKPSWAVMDAADRLIAKHALFLPGRDGFLKIPSGKLVQYELPTKSYQRDGRNWIVNLRSQRWRKEGGKGWLAWQDSRPKYTKWRIGVIKVAVYDSGVNAQWEDGTNFIGGMAPAEAEVRQRLDTQAQGHAATPMDQDHEPVTKQAPVLKRPTVSAKVFPSPSSGMYRKKPDGSLEKVPF